MQPASEDMVVDKETGELRPKKQEGGPGRKPIPREKKAGVYKFVPFNDEESSINLGKTKKGKRVNVRRDEKGRFEIYFPTGGPIPRSLSGKYTSYEQACEKARLYIEAYI